MTNACAPPSAADCRKPRPLIRSFVGTLRGSVSAPELPCAAGRQGTPGSVALTHQAKVSVASADRHGHLERVAHFDHGRLR